MDCDLQKRKRGKEFQRELLLYPDEDISEPRTESDSDPENRSEDSTSSDSEDDQIPL